MTIDLSSALCHYGACALTVILPSLGVSFGQAFTSAAALEALNLQPHARSEISRTLLIALVLIETAAIISFIVGFQLMLFGPHTTFEHAAFIHYGELGIALALGIGGAIAGTLSCLPARQACLAIARQPFLTNKIQLLMGITQSLMQTPIIFGLIISLFILKQLETITLISDSFRFIGAGLCIGIGSIGPIIGLARLSEEACQSVGINRSAFSKVLSFTVVSAALIESAIIFCLVIALFLLNMRTSSNTTSYQSMIYVAAGAVMAIGTLGVGISSGRLTAQACKVFSRKPELYSEVSKVSFFSQVLIETSAVYALVISVFLLISI
jgi:F-type H+-transporting ATPase subunit c